MNYGQKIDINNKTGISFNKINLNNDNQQINIFDYNKLINNK